MRLNCISKSYYSCSDCHSEGSSIKFSAILFVLFSVSILFGTGIIVEAATASSSCTLVWTAPGDDGVIGTASAYDLRYSTDSALLINSFESTDSVHGLPSPSPAGQQDSITVNNLQNGTVYFFAIKTVDDARNVSAISNIVKIVNLSLAFNDEDLPQSFSLTQNYPNPFNPSTTIGYSVPANSHVRLTIYNIRGQTIATLVDGVKPQGRYEETWNGTNEVGSQVASGVYFYRLETNQNTETKKMVLLK